MCVYVCVCVSINLVSRGHVNGHVVGFIALDQLHSHWARAGVCVCLCVCMWVCVHACMRVFESV